MMIRVYFRLAICAIDIALQAQVVTAVAALAALGLADQEHLVDLHAVDQLVQEHDLKVDVVADGTPRRRRL